MKKTRKSAKPVSADAIARVADRGEDVSRFFKGQGRMVQPIQRGDVAFGRGPGGPPDSPSPERQR